MKVKTYLVTDGKLVLEVTPVEKGWLTVRAPFHEAVITQARSIPEAFEMARDAMHELKEAAKDSRVELAKTAIVKAVRGKSVQLKSTRVRPASENSHAKNSLL